MKKKILYYLIAFLFICCNNKDPYPPGINIDTPEDGKHIYKGDVLNVNFLISDNDEISSYSIKLSNETTQKEELVQTESVGLKQKRVQTSWTLNYYTKSTFTLHIEASDRKGNKAVQNLLLYGN